MYDGVYICVCMCMMVRTYVYVYDGVCVCVCMMVCANVCVCFLCLYVIVRPPLRNSQDFKIELLVLKGRVVLKQ